jgi:hypothetical protein
MIDRAGLHRALTRRTLLWGGMNVLGAAALSALADPVRGESVPGDSTGGLPGLPHLPRRAKRVIYLFLAGGPSQIDMFDYKPTLPKLHGTELPDSVRKGQRLAQAAGQKSLPCVAPMFAFKRHGRHGTYVSELLPFTAKIVDDITIVKSMYTEAINHDPGITYINTGAQQPGRPSLGAWVSYGLGSPNRNLPAYVVMISKGGVQSQSLFSRLWGSGFLPSQHQGIQFRSSADPVLYLNNPTGIDAALRRRMLDGIAAINQRQFEASGDPEAEARIAQYEMAFRMQTSVPELLDVADESPNTFDLYGPDVHRPGSFAANCLLARRMAERGVPFIQLFHRGWDQHENLPGDLRIQCQAIDQPVMALVQDLKQRGLLDETLVVCGGEFGRTIFCQGKLTADNYGRDHHGNSFTTWLAGGGVKAGYEHGETDDHCYDVIRDRVHIRDLNATILHQLGIDHERLTFFSQGLDQRPTGVEPARVVREILA